jgi:hypothetical protein
MPFPLRAFLFALGLLAVIGTLWSQLMARRSRRWPTTDGRVIQSELVTDPDPREGGTRVEIAYVYWVGGREFKSTRVTFASAIHTQRYKAMVLTRFPLGSQVQVHYDPSAPHTAVLSIEPSPVWLIGAVVGLFFVAFGVLAPLAER